MRKRKGKHSEKLEPVNLILKRVMPPQYELRVKLNEALLEWETIVPQPLGKQSAPLDFLNGELLVTADTPLVAKRLTMMGGNIAHALMERWQIEIKKVKVIVGQRPLRRVPAQASSVRRLETVSLTEKEVKEIELAYLERSPELPEEIASSLARLQAFFMKRFRK